MAKNYSLVLLFSFSISLHLLVVKCQSPMAPALFVFGDSLSDSGSNNFLETIAKVDYKPYGIDFPSGATGRFTNGKTFVDFISEMLGLPFIPAYLSLSTAHKINITMGVNYASGSAGILPESGCAMGENISFDKQIKYFKKTLVTYLFKVFKNPFALSNYLSKSIFLVSIGSNDYINNYLQPAHYNSSKIYTPQQFADLLLNALKRRLTTLYFLGARKFVVFNIGRLGCVPGIVNGAPTPCLEDINDLVLLYNTRFPRMITTLEKTLFGSTFVRGDSYNMDKNSTEAGYTAAQTPCCEVNGATGLCLPDSTPCQDRSTYGFWDAFHPTEIINNGIAIECFSGSLYCVPINVQQLAQEQHVQSY